MSYFLRWLIYRRLRKAGELLSIVRRHYNHQRDILPEKNRTELEAAMATFSGILRDPATSAADLKQASASLEDTAHRWLKAYAFAAYRENFESFLGTAVLVFAFKTFFATPMEIPTGSAQPTFYGITAEDLRDRPEVKIPTGLARLWERWAHGVSYYEIIAEADGELQGITNVRKEIGLGPRGIGKKCDIIVGNRPYTVHWAPEVPEDHLMLFDKYARSPVKAEFKRGEPIVRCRVAAGDRLFVERFTYNFRKPRRGEYFVFQSTGVAPGKVTPGTHYIKRLIAFGGEKVRIGDDRHVYINGRALGTNDSGFERIYAFNPAETPKDSVYSGHVNGVVYRKAFEQFLASTPHTGVPAADLKAWAAARATSYANEVIAYFPNEQTEFTVRPRHYLGFGDNTMSSSDGRHWGDVPEEKVIGKSWFVMWPFSSRWGW